MENKTLEKVNNSIDKTVNQIEQLCKIVNDLAGFRKVRVEDFTETIIEVKELLSTK